MRKTSRLPIRLFLVVCVAVLAGVLTSSANASQLIDRNALNVRLSVNKAGIAMLTYSKRGERKKIYHVLAKGAINARPPIKGTNQVAFKLDRAGGWGFFRNGNYWKHFKNVCGPYQGDQLAWFVTACTMPDGSHWAVQSWQRMLANYGLPSKGLRNSWELRLSHWNTDIPVLTISMDWSWAGRFDHLWGFYTYLDQPVYGFTQTPQGAPLDHFGRNIYVDTFNSRYGAGWKRENSFLAHPPTGGFCYGFSVHRKHGITGKGTKYRATVQGPGVTPDVFWTGDAPGPYDKALDAVANEQQVEQLQGDKRCNIN
ncbi:MAG: hypothetical protein WBQ14_00890 [Gaiellaceae bacterium]